MVAAKAGMLGSSGISMSQFYRIQRCRSGALSFLLARELEFPETQLRMLRRAAPLHDVGKIGVSDSILLKPGKLTPEEFAVIKTHTTIGARILANGRSDFTKMAERIARTHHERWDGSGYPHGLQGEEIPIEGRIVAVIDVFDALTHNRPYKSAWPITEAVAEIIKQSGRQFDPRVVEAFLKLQAQGFPEPSPRLPVFEAPLKSEDDAGEENVLVSLISSAQSSGV